LLFLLKATSYQNLSHWFFGWLYKRIVGVSSLSGTSNIISPFCILKTSQVFIMSKTSDSELFHFLRLLVVQSLPPFAATHVLDLYFYHIPLQ